MSCHRSHHLDGDGQILFNRHRGYKAAQMGFLEPGIVKIRKRQFHGTSGKLSRTSSSPVTSRSSTPITSARRKSRKSTNRHSSCHNTLNSSSAQASRDNNSNLSPLELLPPELLHKVFLLSLNLSLPLASPRLHHVLADQFLQLQILASAYSHPRALTDLISRRFFTSHILHLCEARFGLLDLSGKSTGKGGGNKDEDKDESSPVTLPARLLKPPFTPASMKLLEELIDRGAVLDKNDIETPIQGLRSAIKLRSEDAVKLLVTKVGIKADAETVAMAIEYGLPISVQREQETALTVLMSACGNLRDARIWWAALGEGEKAGINVFEDDREGRSWRGEVRTDVLELLMAVASPPGEVMGALGDAI